MKHVEEFRDAGLALRLADRIRKRSTKPMRLMEFCGGHTVAIFKYGIRQLLPDNIEMLSGPGCPVCVTATADIDKGIAIAHLPNVTVASFGDMIRVPGSCSSLQKAKAEGGDVRVVYSPQDALYMARDNPGRAVVFVGIGFETTAPTIAAVVLQAEQENIGNFYVLSLHKLCPPIMKTILDLGEVRLSGIIGPGHVSSIIGSHPYEFLARDYHIACVVSGFEPVDILLCIDMLVNQIEDGEAKVEIAYRRGVKPEGNKSALEIMNRVFEVDDADWRGIGVVPASGLRFNKAYRRFDAESKFDIRVEAGQDAKGCICGAILRGVSTPLECELFGQTCTPQSPVGPCMVSSEGSCATYFQYGNADGR